MNKSSYNPFNDTTLHSTVNQERSVPVEERAAFNDVIKHGDAVAGLQVPKRMDHYPRWFQNPQKIAATISVLIFASFMVYQVIQIIIAIVSGT